MMDVVKLTAIAGQQDNEAHSLPLSGLIYKVRLVLSNNPGNYVDVTLNAIDDPPGENIVDRKDVTSNVTLYPRRAVQDSGGISLTLDGTRQVVEPYAVHGSLRLSLREANLGGQCTAYIWLIRL